MDAYSFWKIYEPLRLHFTSPYDVLKYGAKSDRRINRKVFDKKTDTARFTMLGNHLQSSKAAGQFCIANFVYNEPQWAYHAYEETKEIYNRWKAIRESQLQYFKNDIDKLVKAAEAQQTVTSAMFESTPSGNKPPLLQAFVKGAIAKETLVILDQLRPFIQQWISLYDHDPFISDQLFIVKKYASFIKPNLSQYSEVIKF